MGTDKAHATILIVDDEPEIRRLMSVLLTRFLDRWTVKVTEAANAEDAFAALARTDFDVIISDHSMPGKSGIDLLEHAHRQAPSTGRVLITALAQLDIGVDAINRGRVDGFLRKPWDNDAFIALVDSLLTRRVPQREAAAPPARTDTPAERAALAREIEEIDRQLGQLRVKLGLGTISADGYRRVSTDLTKRRAQIEVALMRARA